MTRALPPLLLCSLLAIGAACTQRAARSVVDVNEPTAELPADAPAPAVPSAPFSTKPAVNRLALIHLSDSEAGLLPDPAQPKAGGLARTRAIITALKERANGNALVVHGGDSFIPAPELSLDLDGRSALLAGNDQLLLQASGLGNHEFDLGESFLADAIKGAAFPYVTASLEVKGGPLKALVVAPGAAAPWAHEIQGKLVPRAKACAGAWVEGACQGLVVGLVGSTTEQLHVLSKGASQNLQVPKDLEGVRAAVQTQVDALEAEGIKVIVLLSHLQGIGRDLELAKKLRGVDLLVSAGGENRLASERHRLLPGDVVDRACTALGEPCFPTARTGVDGRPLMLVATGGDLRYVGDLTASFDEDGVLVQIDDAMTRPWPVDEMTLLELRARIDGATLAFQERVAGGLEPLLKPVAESDVWFEGTREEVRNRQTNLGDLSADAILWAARQKRPDVVATLRNGGGIRAPIGRLDPRTFEKQGGPIRLLDVQAALRFDGPLVVVDTTHAALARTLESALRGAGSGKGHFPQVSTGVALRYTTDAPEQTHVVEGGKTRAVKCVGARVRDLVITPATGAPIVVVKDGRLPTPQAKIAVATLEYLAGGGDGWFPAETGLAVSKIPDLTEQSALKGYLAAEEQAGRWRRGAGYVDEDPARARITPVDGAGVVIPPGCP